MEIKTEGNTVNIYGNIKSLQDFEQIKIELDNLIKTYKSITLNIVDSISITSSVIGYLNKLVHKDNINIKINVHNEQLYEIFEELNLISTFNVSKI